MSQHAIRLSDTLFERWGIRVTLRTGLFAVAILMVGILDVISTNAGLLAGAVEANPLMAMTQDVLGWWWFAPKLALQGIAVAIVLMHPVRAVYLCVGAVVAFNAFIVLNNFSLAGAI
jgi:hypothetical protein